VVILGGALIVWRELPLPTGLLDSWLLALAVITGLTVEAVLTLREGLPVNTELLDSWLLALAVVTWLIVEAVLALRLGVTLVLVDPETEAEAETLLAMLALPHSVEDCVTLEVVLPALLLVPSGLTVAATVPVAISLVDPLLLGSTVLVTEPLCPVVPVTEAVTLRETEADLDTLVDPVVERDLRGVALPIPDTDSAGLPLPDIVVVLEMTGDTLTVTEPLGVLVPIAVRLGVDPLVAESEADPEEDPLANGE